LRKGHKEKRKSSLCGLWFFPAGDRKDLLKGRKEKEKVHIACFAFFAVNHY
jgi:hypothetical protein